MGCRVLLPQVTRRSDELNLDYQVLASAWAAATDSDEGAVGGAWDRIGSVELAVLRACGLRQAHTLVDWGCGTGRLAVKAIPFLTGAYVGIDIAEAMIDRGRRNATAICPEPRCVVTWLHENRRSFPLPDGSVDMICAFSVFTHMEHEDAFAYLVDARRIAKADGRFVYSCLPLELDYARRVFGDSAALDVSDRWATQRNVVTSRELMDEIATLAGWKPIRWYRGDRSKFRLPDGSREPLGQSVCVLSK